MQPFSLAAVLALVTVSVLGAASPPKVETKNPAGADVTIPTITGLPPANAAADAEEGATNILLLPGEPRPQAVEVKAEQSPAKAEVVPLKQFVAPPPASHFRSQAANMSLPEPQVPRAPESAILARSTVNRGLTDVRLDRPSPLRRDPPPPRFAPELERDPALYLQRQLGLWKIGDARKVFGDPARQRAAYDAEKILDGQVYAFADPTRRYRELELDFAQDTGALRAVYVYPWSMKWEDCRKLWGANVTAAEASNGRKFFSYENRRLDVLVDRSGKVVSLGLY
jgi:hypothetical protein